MTVANLHLPRTFTTESGHRGFRTRPGDWTLLRRELHLQAALADEAERGQLLAIAGRLAPDRDGEVHLAHDDVHQLLRQVALATVVRPDASDAPRRLAVLKVLMRLLGEHHQTAIRDEVRRLLRVAQPSRRAAR
jgi:hypothetical protein